MFLIFLLECLSVFFFQVHAMHPRGKIHDANPTRNHAMRLIQMILSVFALGVRAVPLIRQTFNVLLTLVRVIGITGMSNVMIIAILVCPVQGTGTLYNILDGHPKEIILVAGAIVLYPQNPLINRLSSLQKGTVEIRLIRRGSWIARGQAVAPGRGSRNHTTDGVFVRVPVV